MGVKDLYKYFYIKLLLIISIIVTNFVFVKWRQPLLILSLKSYIAMGALLFCSLRKYNEFLTTCSLPLLFSSWHVYVSWGYLIFEKLRNTLLICLCYFWSIPCFDKNVTKSSKWYQWQVVLFIRGIVWMCITVIRHGSNIYISCKSTF